MNKNLKKSNNNSVEVYSTKKGVELSMPFL